MIKRMIKPRRDEAPAPRGQATTGGFTRLRLHSSGPRALLSSRTRTYRSAECPLCIAVGSRGALKGQAVAGSVDHVRTSSSGSLPAQRRFAAECAGMAFLAVLWLACLVLGVGGPQTTQAISDFGLIAAAACAGSPVWSMPGAARPSIGGCGSCWASALSWGSGQGAGPGTRPSWAARCRSRRWPTWATWHGAAGRGRAAAAAGRRRAWRSRSAVLDGLMIAASLLLVSWVLVLGPAVPAGGDSFLRWRQPGLPGRRRRRAHHRAVHGGPGPAGSGPWRAAGPVAAAWSPSPWPTAASCT